MAFLEEPTGWEKTILSDLQGSWSILRRLVADNAGFQGWERILPHIDEAMSWESVRDFNQMKNTLVLVKSIAQQTNVSDEIMVLIEDVREILYEVLDETQSKK